MKLLAVLALAAALATAALLPPPRIVLPPNPAAAVRGVLHVHSDRSDGTGSHDEISAAAARAGLSFVIFTDHGDAASEPSAPAYRHGVLCVDAVEISTDQGHVVALGLPRLPFVAGGRGADVLEDIARFGGTSIVAHPTSRRASLQWTGGEDGFDGLEWLNGDSEWRDEPPWTLARVLATYWFRPAESLVALIDRPTDALSLWDRVGRVRAVIGVAAADAHARIGFRGVGEPYDGRPVARIPGYESVFRAFSVVLPGLRLTGAAAADAAAVLGAIRAGRVVSVLDGLAGPAWLEFSAANGAGEATAGGVLEVSGAVTLRARAPEVEGASLRLLRDGAEIAVSATQQELVVTQPGDAATYRVEVELPSAPGRPKAPWLVSNPVYVGRRAAMPWSEPVAPEWPTQRLPLYTDGEAGDWAIERSARADGRLSAIKAVAGTQLAFRFALGGSQRDNPFVAAVRALPASAAGYDRLLFEGRASRPMRISAQLRTAADAGGRRWVRSVYLDESLRRVSLAFAEFVPAGHDGELAADALRSVLFVVDGVNTALGQNGQVWLDEVALGAPGAAPAPASQVRTDSRR